MLDDLLSLDLGVVGCFQLFKEEVLPVDLLVEAVALDVLHSVLEVTVSLGQVAAEEVLHKGLALAI
jgi:hypothetical protein